MKGTRNSRPAHWLKRLSRSLTVGAGTAVARFPVAVLLIACLSAVSNVELAERFFWSSDVFARLLAAMGCAAAISVALRLALESRARAHSIWLFALPLAAAVGIGAIIWFGDPLSLYAPALVCSALLAIPLAPFVGKGSAAAFWAFTLWTGVGVALAFFSVLLFTAGVFAILEMIRFLFNLDLGWRATQHIWMTALTLVGPLFALGRIPRADDHEMVFGDDDRLVRAVRPLFDWVAAPLALAASLVLHLYALRILVTGEVPVGEIGWIVTVFLLLVLSLQIAVHPFLAAAAPPTRLFARIWAVSLIVPLGLLGMALWLRVASEGFTTERYYLTLAFFAGIFALLAQIHRKTRGDIRVLAAIPIVLLALSVAGPWGVRHIVGISQSERIEAEAGALTPVLGPERIEALGAAERARLRSRLLALDEVGQLWRITDYLPPDSNGARATLAFDEGRRGRALLQALGLDRGASGTALTDAGLPRSFAAAAGTALELEGFDLGTYGRQTTSSPSQQPGTDAIALHFEAANLVVGFAGVQDSFDLSTVLAQLPVDLFEASEGAAPPVADITSPEGRTIRLRFDALTLKADGTPDAASLTLLLRRAEWPSLGGG